MGSELQLQENYKNPEGAEKSRERLEKSENRLQNQNFPSRLPANAANTTLFLSKVSDRYAASSYAVTSSEQNDAHSFDNEAEISTWWKAWRQCEEIDKLAPCEFLRFDSKGHA